MAYQIFDSGIRELFGPTGDVGRYHARVMRDVENAITVRTPVDTGRMRVSWQRRTRLRRGEILEGEVYNDTEYLPFHVTGTGIYGPRARPIEPITAPFLSWRSRGGEWIFAKSVRGIPKNNFIRDGMEAGSPWPVEYWG